MYLLYVCVCVCVCMCVYAYVQMCVCVCLCGGNFPQARPCGLSEACNRSAHYPPHAYNADIQPTSTYTYVHTDMHTSLHTYMYVLHCCACCTDSDVIILVRCTLCYTRSYATLARVNNYCLCYGRHCGLALPCETIAMGLLVLRLDHK